jgi:hypothetical protein
MTPLRASALRALLGLLVASLGAGACTTDDSNLPRRDAGGDAGKDGGDAGGAAAVLVMPPTGPARTTEAGGEVAFYVSLGRQPAAEVNVPITSSKPGEGKVSPARLTFTTVNWRAPQKVTITGVDDPAKDGDQTYTVAVGPAVSDDPAFMALSGPPVALTNLDDEMAGLVVSLPSTATSEAGLEAAFTVVLQSRPAGAVSVAVTSDDPGEGTVSPAMLAFTPDNWNAPQQVTVTGVDDPDVDGRIDYTVTVGPVTGADPTYTALAPVKVPLANVDNDSPGISVVAMANLTTTEAGGTAELAVVLNTRPGADVTVPVSSNNTAEGTVAPASLTFTGANWNAPQKVTVTGVNDDVADGNQMFTLVLGVATSADTGYAGVDPADVTVTNIDNDSPGITVAPLTGLTTTEAGGAATFTVVLNSKPSADVVVGVSSSDTSEGTVAPASLTFTPANWSAPQTVTVTGVNDDLADGNQTYNIVTAPAVSGDAAYMGVDPANVTGVSNTDNDSAGITVAPVLGLTTTEAGGTAAFTVVLNSRPAADVTIALTSSDTSEGTVAPASLTFTPANWNAPQTVTVTGVNDDLADGNQVYGVVTAPAASTDTQYAGIDAANVALSNTDNDSAGVTVTPTTGLTTTEAGGTATFTVVLNSQPTADVVVGVTSSDTGEGTVAPASLTFTAMNWNAPQTVTVTGINDDVADGNQSYTLVTAAATSADPGYNGVDAANVTASNTDNDSAGITVTPTMGLTTTEGGGTATFTVVLNSQPTADVVIGLASGDTDEGTVTPASLTFTATNWAMARTVTVTGVNDDVADGNQPYVVTTAPAVSTDTGYSGLDAANVAVNNTDNDSAGITVTPTTGLTTTEGGGTATFTVVLNSRPTADVTIALTSGDLTEGTVAPASLTFTAANWATAQTVTVTGVNDDLDDGNQPYSVVTAPATSADLGYSGRDAMNVAVTNSDDDSAGITVSAISGHTTEAGGTATFTVVLTSQPTADVSIGLASSDVGEGTASPANLTFTSTNWSTAQTVTVTGVNDDLDDGNQPFTIVTAAATSTDAEYNGLDPVNATVTNDDDDTAGYVISSISGNTTEAGMGMATFTVRLTAQPSADVTIAVSSDDATEGTVPPASSLVFTGGNWNMNQTVTVTGVNDGVDDGDVAYHVVLGAASSADPAYNALDPMDVTVVNVDDDVEIRMFSAGGHNGAVGNRAAVNTLCSAAATGWAMGKTIRAFISLDASDEIQDLPGNNAGLPTTVPIKDLTGASTIADTWTDLLDGDIDVALGTAGVTSNVWWSFSTSAGALSVDNCNGGTDGTMGFGGQAGGHAAMDGTWMDTGNPACDTSRDVLCIAY